MKTERSDSLNNGWKQSDGNILYKNKDIQRDTTQNVNGRMAELITLQRAKRYVERNTCDGNKKTL